MKISAVIVTYNEEDKLKTCLQNIVDWADEVVVVDVESTDSTRDVVRSFRARYVSHAHVAYVELVRNFAIAQCTGDWILVLDPDEQLTESLQHFLRAYAQNNIEGALNIPRKNIFFGRWIRHTNFWPDYQIRFFSKGAVTWQALLHSYPTTSLPNYKLPQHEDFAILHVSYPTVKSFFIRQKRYADIRAQERFENGEKFSLLSPVYFSLREFSSRYIKHSGFLDGWWGVVLVAGLIYYHWCVEWKLGELQRRGK